MKARAVAADGLRREIIGAEGSPDGPGPVPRGESSRVVGEGLAATSTRPRRRLVPPPADAAPEPPTFPLFQAPPTRRESKSPGSLVEETACRLLRGYGDLWNRGVTAAFLAARRQLEPALAAAEAAARPGADDDDDWVRGRRDD